MNTFYTEYSMRNISSYKVYSNFVYDYKCWCGNCDSFVTGWTPTIKQQERLL